MHADRAVAHAGKAAYYANTDARRSMWHGDRTRAHVNRHFFGSEPVDARREDDIAWGAVDEYDLAEARQLAMAHEASRRRRGRGG
jgi:hypothetical protein